jgi:hypothetical protein
MLGLRQLTAARFHGHARWRGSHGINAIDVTSGQLLMNAPTILRGHATAEDSTKHLQAHVSDGRARAPMRHGIAGRLLLAEPPLWALPRPLTLPWMTSTHG